MSVTIAVDAMGGDHGPPVTVAAAANYLRKHGDVKILLVGKPDAIGPVLSRSQGTTGTAIEIVEASEVVGMDEAPAQALRRKKNSSRRVAIDLVKEGRADACVSAGKTGALMPIAILVLSTPPAIVRPAI